MRAGFISADEAGSQPDRHWRVQLYATAIFRPRSAFIIELGRAPSVLM